MGRTLGAAGHGRQAGWRKRSLSNFGQALLEHAPALHRYARALTGDRSRADDLLQDCLERALAHMHQYQPGTNLKAWLFTIMHHLFVSELRSKLRHPEAVTLTDLEVEAPNITTDSATLDDLDTALARLPPDHRSVLMLVCVEGWGYQDAARILEVPLGTVMSRLHRAREAMRKHLFAADEPGAMS